MSTTTDRNDTDAQTTTDATATDAQLAFSGWFEGDEAEGVQAHIAVKNGDTEVGRIVAAFHHTGGGTFVTRDTKVSGLSGIFESRHFEDIPMWPVRDVIGELRAANPDEYDFEIRG